MVNFVYNTEEITKKQVELNTQPIFEPYEIDNIYSHTQDFNFEQENAVEIASRLIETAKKYRSYSCCANQVGLNLSVFVAGYDQEFVAFFNPRIVDYSLEESLSKESDNISFPGLVLNIYRSNKILVEYQDYEGNIHQNKFEGLTARTIQQCVDRLQGIGIDYKVSKLQLQRANKALNKKIKTVVRYQMNQLKVKK